MNKITDIIARAIWCHPLFPFGNTDTALAIARSIEGDIKKIITSNSLELEYECTKTQAALKQQKELNEAARPYFEKLTKALKPFSNAADTLSAIGPDGIDDGIRIVCRHHNGREFHLSSADFTAAKKAIS